MKTASTMSLAAVAMVAALSGGAIAQGQVQSLEKTYADLCATQQQRTSEVCRALSSALAEKLRQDFPDAGSADARSPATAASGAGQAAPWRERWGLYADMVGKDWATGGAAGYDLDYANRLNLLETSIVRYRWVVPGEELEMTSDVGSGHHNKALLKWDAAGRRLVSGEGAVNVVEADGSIRGLETTAGDLTMRTSTVRLPDGSIRTTTEKKENGIWHAWLTGTLVERTPESLAQARQDLAAAERQRQAAEQARAQAERQARIEEERRRQERGNMLGSLLVAGAGAVAAGVNGGDATQIMGGALKGYQIANADNPLASQVGAQADAMIMGGPAGTRSAYDDPSAGVASAGQPAVAGTASQAGAPMRFVLSIGLQPRNGDSVNPTCYSNVITRPGPSGWGQRGFLPPGSAQSAHATVQAFKPGFIAACRAASGRDITSEGNFHWTWNETRDGDEQIANTRAQYREDVTVDMD
jgi:hypothetical protein